MYTITTVVLVAQSFYYEVINPKPEEQAEEEAEEAETLEVSERRGVTRGYAWQCRADERRTIQCLWRRASAMKHCAPRRRSSWRRRQRRQRH